MNASFDSELYWLYTPALTLIEMGVDEKSICEDINDEKMVQAPLTRTQVEELIPKDTFYCYNIVGKDGDKLIIKTCPFHDSIPHFPHQGNGYCHYLRGGDDAKGGLLWDSCKECGINEPEID